MITEYVLPFIYSAMACVGFAMMFNLRDLKVLTAACVGGGIVWVVYLLFTPTGSPIFQNLMGSIAAAIYSEIMARVFKTPVTVFLTIGVVPLVPGAGIYFTMKYCIQGNMGMFIQKGVTTFGVAGAIAVGAALVGSAVRIYDARKADKLRLKENKSDS